MYIEYLLIFISLTALSLYVWWKIKLDWYCGVKSFKVDNDNVDIYYRVFNNVRRLSLKRTNVSGMFKIEHVINGDLICIGYDVDLTEFVKHLKRTGYSSRNAKFLYYLLTHKRGNLTSLFSYRSLKERRDVELVLVELNFEILAFLNK